MGNSLMNAMDAVAGSLASAFVTLGDGNRYNLMQLTSFEASMEIKMTEVPVMGRSGKGNKPAGWTGAWKGTVHYNTSIFRTLLLEYKKTGVLQPFDIQITNEDSASAAGQQTTILTGCLPKGGILAKLDADSEILDEDLEGTFDDFEVPTAFTLLPGMQITESTKKP